MNFFKSKGFTQKIIIAIVVVILFNFIVPVRVQADGWDIGGDLLKEFVHLLAALGDVFMGALNKMMVGVSSISSTMLPTTNANFKENGANNSEETRSSLYATNSDVSEAKSKGTLMVVNGGEMDGLLFSDWRIPNIMYSPESIFSNRIAALDVNFINPHTYTSVEFNATTTNSDGNSDGNSVGSSVESSEDAAVSTAFTLGPTIAAWYKSFRNIAIVGLLSVLIFLGIRILLSSTAENKAKYKETMKDWLVAMVLVFAIHFIMAGLLMLTERVTNLFAGGDGNDIVVLVTDNGKENGAKSLEIGEGNNGAFRTNLTGYVRFMAQSSEFQDAAAYTIIYLALVIYTVMFTFTYFKRLMYMAFFTMIAPLAALTYPVDKAGDGKAQAFNLWFKEYTMNLIIQPIHLVLYTVLVTSAIGLAADNPIYALVAIGFLLPAEKFIKKMFGLDKSETAAGLGAVAGGALAMKGVGAVAGLFKGKAKGGSKDGNDDSGDRGTTKAIDRYNRGANEGHTSAEDVLGEEENQERGALPTSNGEDTEGNSNEGEDTSSIEPNTREYNDNNIDGLNNPNNLNNPNDQSNLSNNEQQQNTVKVASDKFRKSLENRNNTEEISEESIEENEGKSRERRPSKVMNAVREVGSHYKRRIGRAMSPENVGQKVWKVAKKVPKAAVSLGGAAEGAAVTGRVAGAAALTTGDLEKGAAVFAGGLATGAGVGAGLGSRAANRMGNTISNEANNIKTITQHAMHSPEEIKKKKQAQFDAEFKSSEKNYEYLMKKGMNSEQAKEFLDNSVQPYLDAGVTDINTIYKASQLNLKDERSKVARAELASKLPKDFATNEEAKVAFRENLMKRNKGKISDKKVNEVMDDIIKIRKV